MRPWRYFYFVFLREKEFKGLEVIKGAQAAPGSFGEPEKKRDEGPGSLGLIAASLGPSVFRPLSIRSVVGGTHLFKGRKTLGLLAEPTRR